MSLNLTFFVGLAIEHHQHHMQCCFQLGGIERIAWSAVSRSGMSPDWALLSIQYQPPLLSTPNVYLWLKYSVQALLSVNSTFSVWHTWYMHWLQELMVYRDSASRITVSVKNSNIVYKFSFHYFGIVSSKFILIGNKYYKKTKTN